MFMKACKTRASNEHFFVQKSAQYLYKILNVCIKVCIKTRPVKEKSFQPPFLYFKWALCQMVQMSAHVCNVNLEKCRYLHNADNMLRLEALGGSGCQKHIKLSGSLRGVVSKAVSGSLLSSIE